MHHRTSISIFSKIGLVDRSKSCTQIDLPKKSLIACIKLQLPIVILKYMRRCINVHVYQFLAKSGE